MPHIVVSPFGAPEHNPFVGIYDVTHRTTINSLRGQVATHVVVGYGVTDHGDLREAILEATVRLYHGDLVNTSQEEKEKKIKELREKDEARLAVSYSRQCNICYTPNPETRAVLTTCGHSLCMACVLTLSKNGRLACPFCRKSTAYVKLHEDISEEPKKKEDEGEEEENEVSEKISKLPITPPLVIDSSPSSSLPPSNRPVDRRRFPRTSLNGPTPRHNYRSPHRRPNTDRFAHSILVSNLPLATTESDIIRLFAPTGQIIKIRFDYATSRRKSAFCDFKDAESAQSVRSAFADFQYKGHILRICDPVLGIPL